MEAATPSENDAKTVIPKSEDLIQNEDSQSVDEKSPSKTSDLISLLEGMALEEEIEEERDEQQSIVEEERDYFDDELDRMLDEQSRAMEDELQRQLDEQIQQSLQQELDQQWDEYLQQQHEAEMEKYLDLNNPLHDEDSEVEYHSLPLLRIVEEEIVMERSPSPTVEDINADIQKVVDQYRANQQQQSRKKK